MNRVRREGDEVPAPGLVTRVAGWCKAHVAWERVGPTTVSWAMAFLLAIFAVYPALAHPIEEYAQDAAAFHVYRGVVFTAARADGLLFPRWAPAINAGLGGPLFAFYAPMVYYLMDALHALGIAHPLAWRLITALALLAGAAGMFGLALRLFRRADVALVCSVAFTYAPHLLKDLFERGSPQGLPVVLYPWMLWALLRLAERPSGRRLAVASACWAVMLLLHTAAALWLVPVIGLFLLYVALRVGRRPIWICIAALAAGLLLVSFFLVPLALERQYVQAERNHAADYTRPDLNPLALADLLALPAVFDTGLAHNGMGVSLGLLYALALVVGLGVGLMLWRRKCKCEAVLTSGAALLGLATIWLQTGWSDLVWRALPLLNILEFRWRLQSTIGLLGALILGSLLAFWPRRYRGAIAAALVIVCLGQSLPSLYPQLLPHWTTFPPEPTPVQAEASGLEIGAPGLSAFSEELPRWRELPFTEEEAQRVAATPIANLPQGGQVVSDERRTGEWHVRLETPSSFDAALHVLYFPGWVGYLDGARVPLSPMPETGYARMEVPAGSHELTLRYEGTLTQHVGDCLTVLAAVGLALLACFWRGRSAPQPADDVAYLRPRCWLPLGVVLIAVLKLGWVDPHTAWLRYSSTCQAIHGAEVQTDVWFGDRVHLCGYTMSHSALYPSGTVRLTLYWQVDQPVAEPAHSFVHLVATRFNPPTGYPVLDQQDKEAPGLHPLTQWLPGRLYEDTYELRVPAGLSPAEYQLEVGWWEPATGQRLTPRIVRPHDTLAVSRTGSLLVFEHAFGSPKIQHTVRATLGREVRLLGYRLTPEEAKAGETLRLTLYWQAVAPTQTSYTVFTHILDASGTMRAGHDGIPVYSQRPTDSWLAGEVQIDEHEIQLPADASPGNYAIEVGMYDAATGVRLPAFDAAGRHLEQDRVLLGGLVVQ